MPEEELPADKTRTRSRWPRILGVMAILFVAVAILCAWWVKRNLYASQFRPTTLNEKEQQVLNAKLDRLERSVRGDGDSLPAAPTETTGEGRLQPERYVEDAASREIRITQKELNAFIARDEETARRVAVALTDDQVSVKLVLPVDKDIPVLGGKTLRLNCGMTLRHEWGRPVVALRGVSVGGIPLPGAWMGNIKNMDLVREFGSQGGFWQLFSDGVEDMKVSEGFLVLKLKE